jgi:hypothetical protein
MPKNRVCVAWFEKGEPKKRWFRVPSDDTWHDMVRAYEMQAIEGFWVLDDVTYNYHELG